jgi:hypothetical protein
MMAAPAVFTPVSDPVPFFRPGASSGFDEIAVAAPLNGGGLPNPSDRIGPLTYTSEPPVYISEQPTCCGGPCDTYIPYSPVSPPVNPPRPPRRPPSSPAFGVAIPGATAGPMNAAENYGLAQTSEFYGRAASGSQIDPARGNLIEQYALPAGGPLDPVVVLTYNRAYRGNSDEYADGWTSNFKRRIDSSPPGDDWISK